MRKLSKIRLMAVAVMGLLLTSCTVYDSPKALKSWKGTSSQNGDEIVVNQGDKLTSGGTYRNFILSGQAKTEEGATAALLFHSDGESGYKVLFHNGPEDGSRMTGSLETVRNLYSTLTNDGEWFDFTVAVREKNIEVCVDGQAIVCYTEPSAPYRTPENQGKLLSQGKFYLEGQKGSVSFRNLNVTALKDGTVNPNDTVDALDEQTDQAIRFQQKNFPVIDYHVHMKGGLTPQMTRTLSMRYGINYGVAPNTGIAITDNSISSTTNTTAENPLDTGMLSNNEILGRYWDAVKNMPFFHGLQGEGRKWIIAIDREKTHMFDYLFTDAMTIVYKGQLTRMWLVKDIQKEFGLDDQAFMEMFVDQACKILTNEPADFYANPFYIPDPLNDRFDELWTDARVNKILDILAETGMALEINARYLVPSERIIKMAKARGIKFTFGTNNADFNFGRLEYSLEMAEKCGLTVEDMWFPTMGTRFQRTPVNYNNFTID